MPDEGQSAGFASKRPGPNSEETGIRGLERVRIEVADEHFILLAAVIVDGFDQIAAQMFRSIEVRDFARPELGRERELRTRHQPMRKVIALRMVHQAIGGQRLQGLFQLVQILGSSYFSLVGHTKNEIAETE